MERPAAPEHDRHDSDRARVENAGVGDENIATDDVDQQPSEGMTVDDV